MTESKPADPFKDWLMDQLRTSDSCCSIDEMLNEVLLKYIDFRNADPDDFARVVAERLATQVLALTSAASSKIVQLALGHADKVLEESIKQFGGDVPVPPPPDANYQPQATPIHGN